MLVHWLKGSTGADDSPLRTNNSSQVKHPHLLYGFIGRTAKALNDTNTGYSAWLRMPCKHWKNSVHTNKLRWRHPNHERGCGWEESNANDRPSRCSNNPAAKCTDFGLVCISDHVCVLTTTAATDGSPTVGKPVFPSSVTSLCKFCQRGDIKGIPTYFGTVTVCP